MEQADCFVGPKAASFPENQQGQAQWQFYLVSLQAPSDSVFMLPLLAPSISNVFSERGSNLLLIAYVHKSTP